MQKSGWTTLSTPLFVKTKAGTYSADKIIGRASSIVLLDSANRKIIKILPKDWGYVGTYEKLVTEFLVSKGEKVPSVLFSGLSDLDHMAPELGLDAGKYPVSIREYYEGVTRREIKAAKGDDFIRSELDMSLTNQILRIRYSYFENGTFLREIAECWGSDSSGGSLLAS